MTTYPTHPTVAGAVIDFVVIPGLCVTGIVQLVLLARSAPQGRIWLAQRYEPDRWLYRREEPARFWFAVILKLVVYGLFAIGGGYLTVATLSAIWLRSR